MTTRAARRSSNAPHSGYQRVELGEMVLLMDAGGPPPISVSQEAHAGCLSFELSHGLQRIVVNCGLPANQPRDLAAGGARHRGAFHRGVQRHIVVPLSRRRLVQAPARHADRQRPEPTSRSPARSAATPSSCARRTTATPTASGVIHQRALKLALAGNRIDGEDLFVADRRRHASRQDVADEFAVRFHLHPSVKANKLTDGHGAMLMLPSRDVWTFNAYEDRVEIEESVYLSGSDGPRRAVQIVIYGRARKIPRVHWTFAHIPSSGSSPGRKRGDEPNCR